jgi:trigger factor
VLKIETELLEDRQARLVVTVEPDRLQQEMDNAARRIAKNLNIPGFRKGKAPNHIVRRYIGGRAI